MSSARVGGFTFRGIEAAPVEVKARFGRGASALLIAGLPKASAARAQQRVRAALASMGLSLPGRRILIELAPAVPQEGDRRLDLPIALCVLAALDLLPPDELAGYAALGGLSADGALVPVAGVLPAAIAASARDVGLICPAAQGAEAAWAGRIEVLAASSLLALINHFRGTQVLALPGPVDARAVLSGPDLADVRGMETARRALEVAAAGGHGLLLVGPPGGGKSMLAARLPGLLPDLTPKAALEVAMIHSAAGPLDGGRSFMRPPSRTVAGGESSAAPFGGGLGTGPSEVSLAYRGTLFLNRLPEFHRAELDALRGPMEDGRAIIVRGDAQVTYPARFQLVAAMSPCRCGRLGYAGLQCCQAPRCGADQLGLVSAGLLDRFDLVVQVQPAPAQDPSCALQGEASAAVAARVAIARRLQAARAGDVGAPTNAEADVTSIELDVGARALADQAAERLRLDIHGSARLLRVSRTIADLGGARLVRTEDVAEALAYRHRWLARQG